MTKSLFCILYLKRRGDKTGEWALFGNVGTPGGGEEEALGCFPRRRCGEVYSILRGCKLGRAPRQSQILLTDEVVRFSQLGQRRRTESGHRSLAGSGRAHSAQFGPVDTGDSSPPVPHTAVGRKSVRARLCILSHFQPSMTSRMYVCMNAQGTRAGSFP